MKTLVFALWLIVAGIQVSFAQETATDKEVIELSREKWQWMADRKVEVLDSLFHEKSMFVHMGGSWGKQQELDVIKSGGIWYKKAEVYSVTVQRRR